MLGAGAGQVAVPHQAGVGKERQQAAEEVGKLFGLPGRARVGREAVGIEPALVAHAYGAAVEGAAVGAHLQQTAVLRQGAVATDVEVIAYGAEATCTVVAQQLLYRVVAGATGGRAVQNDVAHGLHRVHHPPALHPGQEGALVAHGLLADGQGKDVLNHGKEICLGDLLQQVGTARHAQRSERGNDGLCNGVQNGGPGGSFC